MVNEDHIFPLNPNLHAAEGEPFLAQVLQRGPDMIDGVVDAEEAVVGVMELSQNLRQLPVISMDRFHHASLAAGSTSRWRKAAGVAIVGND